MTSTRKIHGQFAPLVPRVLDWLGGGRMWPVEGLNGHQRSCGVPEHHDAVATCNILDRGGHIDYLHESVDRIVRGISVRVQEWQPGWDDRWPWNSFTLRCRAARDVDVEWEHLIRAINAPDEAILHPAYHVQTYLRDGRVDSIGMVRVADLVRFMLATPIGTQAIRPQPVGRGAGNMRTAYWDDLRAAGIVVRMWIREQVAA